MCVCMSECVWLSLHVYACVNMHMRIYMYYLTYIHTQQQGGFKESIQQMIMAHTSPSMLFFTICVGGSVLLVGLLMLFR
jgi:hypothetical protein